MQSKVDAALHFVAQKAWTQSSDDFFRALVTFLAETLGVEHALVDTVSENLATAHVIAIHTDGTNDHEPISYPLSGTPCENVVGQNLCSYEGEIQSQFPTDDLLVQMGAQSYIGIPLWDSEATPIGLVAALANAEVDWEALEARQVLQVLALRCAHELERRRAEQDLRAREAQLRAVMQNASFPIMLLSRQGVIRYLSTDEGAAWTPSGRSALQVGRRYFDWIPETAREGIRETFERVRSSGAPQTYTLDLPRVGGERRTFEGRVGAVVEDGEVVGFVNSLLDITDRVSMQERIAHIQKMEALGTLAGGVAHDINNVLAVVLNIGSVLERDLAAEPKFRANLEHIVSAAQRGKATVQRLLRFARKSEREFAVHALGELILEAEGLLERSIGQGVRLSIDGSVAECPALVRVHADDMVQALLNLVINASDAMHGQGEIVISTSSANPPDESASPMVNVHVRDTGPGMDAHTRAHAMEPFFTTKAIGEGTGLGLAMIYSILTEAGGSVRIESELGEGTTVTLQLPTVARMSDSDSSAVEVSVPDVSTPSLHVLIVDDEEMIRLSLSLIFERLGFTVSVASGGAEALALLGSLGSEPDLVVFDLSMPGMSGMECLREIRARSAILPVVISSGHLAPEESAQIEECGVSGVLPKPFSVDELRDFLRGLMEAGRVGSKGAGAAS